MNSQPVSKDAVVPAAGDPASEPSIPALVAEVYEAAPPVERRRLLEQLLRPLALLSLFGIAGGVFANIRFRSGWPEMSIRLEDVLSVRAAQVMALVDHVQQVSMETVEGLAGTLSSSPVMAGSAAAAMLVTLLMRRARSTQTGANPVDSDAPRLQSSQGPAS
jgi:hypothetical protein